MKKALSTLLALALAMSFALCAFAEKAPPEVPGAPKFQSFAPAPGGQSLTFDLPTVTGIAAVWDGNVDALFRGWNGPYFNAETVTVTVSFEDGRTQVLDHWSDSGYNWFWEILYDYDDATGKVTFYYWDSNFRQAYVDTLKWGDDWNWDDLYTMLPQAAVTVPADLLQAYRDSLPKVALKLGETQKAPVQEYTIYTFTPEKDGLYYFYSENYRDCDPYAYLRDVNFRYISFNHDLVDWNFGIIAELQAGKTYYLIVGGYYDYGEEVDQFDVGVRSDMRKLNGWQWLWDLFTGGLFLRRWFIYGNDLYVLPSAGNITDNMAFNGYAAFDIGYWLGGQLFGCFVF